MTSNDFRSPAAADVINSLETTYAAYMQIVTQRSSFRLQDGFVFLRLQTGPAGRAPSHLCFGWATCCSLHSSVYCTVKSWSYVIL